MVDLAEGDRETKVGERCVNKSVKRVSDGSRSEVNRSIHS